MHFSLFPLAILLGSTLASPLNYERRDLAVIESSVKQVSAALSTLDKALKGQKPTFDRVDQEKYIKWLLGMDAQIQRAMGAGAGRIRLAPNLNDRDAARLAFIMEPILRDTRSTMKGWISIKPIAQSAGMTTAVREQLSRGATVCSGYADAIINRLPVINRAIGNTFKTSIMSPIDNTIRSYIR
jgi:hypothetical protein